MADPTPVNKTANTINTGIKITGDTLVNVVEALIISDVPFLGMPVINQLFNALINWLSGYIIRAAETGATFAVIDLQVDHEVSQMAKVTTGVIAAEKTGDADAIKAAIKAYADAHSALIHDDGSATIH